MDLISSERFRVINRDNYQWFSLMDSLEVLPLHQFPEYSKACCDLINTEWKRSKTARMLSLEKSNDNFPTSLVMLHNKTEVVGHSKVSLIPSMPEGCFVESVVVSKMHRGKGWGKYLMLATEDYARRKASRFGLQEMFLSAMDSVPHFYSKLGYVVCEPFNIYGGPPLSSSNNSPGIVARRPPHEPHYTENSQGAKISKTYMKKSLFDEEL